jgi:hypothetical protein
MLSEHNGWRRVVRNLVDAINWWQDNPQTSVETKEVCDTRFFRIHDSGDFSMLGPEYPKVWIAVARALPDVIFWAPTRDWVLPARQQHLPVKRPDNLVLRPSALCVDDEPPMVRGMDAGTTVSYINGVHGCLGCKAYFGGKKDSCKAKRCRVCWLQPDQTVNYKPHESLGPLAKAAGTLGTPKATKEKSTQENPGKTQDTLGDAMLKYDVDAEEAAEILEGSVEVFG